MFFDVDEILHISIHLYIQTALQMKTKWSSSIAGGPQKDIPILAFFLPYFMANNLWFAE